MCVKHVRRNLGLKAVALLALVPAGCRAGASMFVKGAFQPDPGGGIHFGKFEETPKARLGGLPYPGAFTLFELADPKQLGHHAYDAQEGAPEAERGILYTCRGGFIDVAHARKTMDLCKHAAVRAEFVLMNDWSAFQVKSLEPSVFVVHLEYPEFWASLSRGEQRVLAKELSVRIGQRMGMLMMTWHEVLTWFGYRSTPVVSEWPSAFTWDDTGAHAFGVMVAGRALRDSREWDDAVTDAMNSALQELGVVTPQECLSAIERVKDVWWSGSEPLKRQIELGWNGEPVEAWVVPNLPFCGVAEPRRYYLPGLSDVMGRDFSGLVHIEIAPNVGESERIRGVVPGMPERIDADRDLPVIMEYMRQWHARKEGPQALRPQ